MALHFDQSVESIVRRQYDQLAHRYDRRWKSYITRSLHFLRDWATIMPDDYVLDVACGTGEFERILLAQNPGYSIVGVDISDEMLERAREKLIIFPSVSFQGATARSLPFPNAHFDVVVSANSFHYFEQPDLVLQEMRRVLKPEGRLLILDWCRDGWLCKICDVILQWLDPAHRRCYTQAELHGLLFTANFEVARSTKVQLNWLWELMAVEAVDKRF